MSFKSILLLFILLIFITKAYADEDNTLPFSDDLISSIASSEHWGRLIKLEQSGLFKNETPAIHSQTFYFTNISILTKKLELVNTLKAFFSKNDYQDTNQNPQCKFPARYIWLKKKLDLSSIPKVVCDDYLAWSKLSSSNSLSMIFATGYLGNPASYYGHTLLKLNSSKGSDLLDMSINFGADVPDDEDPISYMIKGVTGGYDANFTDSKFYYHTQNYLENELRDLWEYSLNLSTEDYSFLIAHIWEIIEQDYTYYFFDENCVFRMYELFQLIEGIELPVISAPWVIPQEVVRAMNLAKYKNGKLIKKVRYIPSRQANFYNKYWQLSSKSKSIVKSITLNISNLKLIKKTTSDEGIKILSVLLDYYQYLIAIDKNSEAEYKPLYNKILAYRYQLPIGKAKFNSNIPVSPHVARPSSYSQVSYINNKKLGDGISFKLRPAYYDQLDGESGHVKNGSLVMGEFELEYIESKLSIRSFSLFDIVSVKNEASGLPHDNYDSWRLYLGFQKQDDRCRNCTDFTFKGSKGWAIPVNKNLTIGTYLGGAFVENYEDRGVIYASGNLILNQSINNNWNFLIDVEARQYVENKRVTEVTYQAETRYKLKLDNYYLDFRFLISNNETQLSFGYYW